MKLRLRDRDKLRTKFIELDTQKCQACWKCLAGCKNNVIGKVDIIIHKHALIKNPENCTGCLKCVKACEFGAYSKKGAQRGIN
jgi:2-oxoglutarate ferredoxin oxidoreductase subunit delta